MKKIILSLLLAATTSAFAQSSFKGTLVSTDQKPISAANIILITLPDSTLVKGAISDAKGVFELPNTAEHKKIIIKITHLEYEPKILTPSQSQLGTIELTPATNQLGEVVLTARRPIIEQKGTRISTNVAQSSLQNLPRAEMLINFLPGVSTSYTGGGFEVFGKGNPIFFINNRRVRNLDDVYHLSPKDIESIELETQPGAEHDNSVGAVIYIKLKKKQGDGLSGSIENEEYFRKNGLHNNSWANLNYRSGKTDLFLNIGAYNNFKNHFYRNNELQTFTTPHQWRVTTNEVSDNNDKSAEVKVGFSHDFSDKHAIGASVWGGITPYSGHAYTQQETATYRNNAIIAKGLNEYDQFNQNKDLNANAYYEGKLTDKLKLQTDIDYIGQRSNNQTDIIEHNLLTSSVQKVHKHQEASSNWWNLKATFLQQIGKGALNYGTELSNQYRKETYNDNALTTPDIKNTEVRSAGFASWAYPLGKISTKVGLRYEYADFGYYENQQKSEVKSRIYRHWLPNVSVAFPWDKTQFTLSYVRKIKRPAFYELSDYSAYSSPFLYDRGNPYIIPQLNDEWTALATYGPISASLMYGHIRNAIHNDYSLSAINPNVIEKTIRNYDNYNLLKGVLNAQMQIGKWMPKLTLTYYKPFAKDVLPTSEAAFSAELMNQIALNDKWLVLALFNYVSKGTEREYYMYEQRSGVHLFVARMLFNQSLTIYGGVMDAFNQLNNHSEFRNPYIMSRQSKNYENYCIKVGIDYNFNTTQNRYKGHGVNN